MSEALRLRAARLAAGYVVGKDAAASLGIPLDSFRAMERDVVRVSDATAHAAKSRWDISPEFLKAGKPYTSVDLLADRIARTIMVAEKNEDAYRADFPRRLKEMRLSAGYKQATAAARSKGWGLTTYGMHEGGQNLIPVERQVGYALAFGHRPEYAVLGELPKMLPENQRTWIDRRGAGQLEMADDLGAWGWLRRSNLQGMPLLTMQEGKFVLLTAKLSLPAPSLGFDGASNDEGSTRYGYVAPDESGIVHVIEPLERDTMQAFALADGSVELRPAAADVAAPSDPTRRRTVAKDPVALGGHLGRILWKFEATLLMPR